MSFLFLPWPPRVLPTCQNGTAGCQNGGKSQFFKTNDRKLTSRDQGDCTRTGIAKNKNQTAETQQANSQGAGGMGEALTYISRTPRSTKISLQENAILMTILLIFLDYTPPFLPPDHSCPPNSPVSPKRGAGAGWESVC